MKFLFQNSLFNFTSVQFSILSSFLILNLRIIVFMLQNFLILSKLTIQNFFNLHNIYIYKLYDNRLPYFIQQLNKIKMQQKPNNLAPDHDAPASLTGEIIPVITTQHQLFLRYSSSQHYFYSNKINQIIKEKCVVSNIVFEDIQCLLDQEQYLKRQYYQDQYPRKLASFKEYYFYHEDCPRIFGDFGTAEAYEKWQERKRDFMYKKLKFMYNQTYTSMESSDNTVEEPNNNLVNVTHFLMDISDYNPYSKKYYLRVQARQQKQRQQKQRKDKEQQARRIQKQSNQSVFLYRKMKKQLSRMLENMEDELSMLTVMNYESPKNKKVLNLGQVSNKKVIKLNFNKKESAFVNPEHKTEKQKDLKKSKQIIAQNLIIDTEGSLERRSAAKLHKKQVSDLSKNQYQLNNNISGPKNKLSLNFEASEITDRKLKSIMLMSSYGGNKQNQFVNNGKIKLMKFGDYEYKHQTQKYESLSGKKFQNQGGSMKNIQKLEPYGVLANNNMLKSFKSLQKLDRFNPNVLQQHSSSDSKRSYSLSKLQTPIKQSKPAFQSLTRLIDNKISEKQKNLKKTGAQTRKSSVEQFSDRKLQGKGPISYNSLKFNLNKNEFNLASDFASKMEPKQIAKNLKFRIQGNHLSSGDVIRSNKQQSQTKPSFSISIKKGGSMSKMIFNK